MNVYDIHAIEDAYHVCMECPLYDVLREREFTALYQCGFEFGSECDVLVRDLFSVYVSMLYASKRPHVWAIGRFLSDCLAVRAMYAGQDPAGWCTKQRVDSLRAHVLYHPTPQSMPLHMQRAHEVLRECAECDVTLCRQFPT